MELPYKYDKKITCHFHGVPLELSYKLIITHVSYEVLSWTVVRSGL